MEISERALGHFNEFMNKIESETYPETPSQLHTQLTEETLVDMIRVASLTPGSMILDVGCGQGPALSFFAKHGMSPIGITLNDEDVRICREKGFNVLKMDQSFLEFEDKTFDFIWARHCMEHSIFPFFTLWQFNRVSKIGAWLYIEVPGPETGAQHETNLNHYSVLGRSAWVSLIRRSGYELLFTGDLNLDLTAEMKDVYYNFIAKKVKDCR